VALRITIDAFSCRPNPMFVLDGRQAQEALARLRPARKLKKRDLPLFHPSTLGYRGLIIEQIGAHVRWLPKVFRLVNGGFIGPGLSHRPADEQFESVFFERSGLICNMRFASPLLRHFPVEERPLREKKEQRTGGRAPLPPLSSCACAPLYEPSWWNDGGEVQRCNNCYNYATNYRTDTYAQPGLAGGKMFVACTSAAYRAAAKKDGLIDDPGANNRCPGDGHLVALVVRPGWDCHWYRKGRDGLWTHKRASDPATNLDNSRRIILDPRTADRGEYTEFCTFMVVRHGHIKVK
jgi:hypothetical protein